MSQLRWQIGEVSISKIAECCIPFEREALCQNSDRATLDRHSHWLRPHFVDEDGDPPELISQIPKGFAGPPSEVDASRCDASPWLDRVPVIRAFRRQVLGPR